MLNTVKRHIRKRQSVPLYLQIADHLKEQILNKEYPCGSNLPAESELAASFGVNHLTLRKSLQILREQNLIVQQHGRGNFVTYSHDAELKIGYLSCFTESLSAYYDLRVMSECNRLFSAKKWNLFLMSSALGKEEVMEKIHQNKCSALLATAMNPDIINILNSDELKYIPVCCLNVWNDQLNTTNRCYIGSKSGGIGNAVRYLTKLGHRRIAYISHDHATIPNDCGLKERNLEFAACNLPEGSSFIGMDDTVSWHEWARKTMHKIAALSPENRPTAVILPGMTFAAGAWLGALESGLKIPDDISLISIDCAPDLFPQMTTVEQALDQFISKAISLFKDAELAGGLLRTEFYKFDFKIIERGSCRPL